jgi:5-methyltetrahydrofolate--homocysteine methyltransferase
VDEETGPVFSERSAVVTDAPNIPEPPFWGVRVVKNYDLRELFKYINDTALFKNQWQLKTASQEDYARLVEEKYRPIKKKLEEDVIAAGWFEPKVVYGYFPAQGDGNDVVVYDPSQWSDGRPRPSTLHAVPRNFSASPFRARKKAAGCASPISLRAGSGRWMCSACR